MLLLQTPATRTLTSTSHQATATAAPEGDASPWPATSLALGPRRRTRLTSTLCGLRTSAIHNLPPQRSHCLAKALLPQPQTHAGSQAARRRKGSTLGDPRSQWCVIAECGAHTAPPATALKREPLEQHMYQHARHLRSHRPTQESSMIENAPTHTPRPAAQPDTELGEGCAQKQPPADSAVSPRRGKNRILHRDFSAHGAPSPPKRLRHLLAPPSPTFHGSTSRGGALVGPNTLELQGFFRVTGQKHPKLRWETLRIRPCRRATQCDCQGFGQGGAPRSAIAANHRPLRCGAGDFKPLLPLKRGLKQQTLEDLRHVRCAANRYVCALTKVWFYGLKRLSRRSMPPLIQKCTVDFTGIKSALVAEHFKSCTQHLHKQRPVSISAANACCTAACLESLGPGGTWRDL